jgi:hypothetical protein
MKKKMFALAFGLLLAFGVQGQFAQLDPISVDPPDGSDNGGSVAKLYVTSLPGGGNHFDCTVCGRDCRVYRCERKN